MIAIYNVKKPILVFKKYGCRGFTLIEIMMAMTILALSLVAILDIADVSIRTVIRSKELQTVYGLVKNKMVETEFELEAHQLDELLEEVENAFPEPYELFKWKRTIKKVEFPNFLSLLNYRQEDQSLGDGDVEAPKQSSDGYMEMASKVLTNYLNEAIRVVTVSILKKQEGDKYDEIFSVSTFWVDLKHAVSIVQ